VKQIPAALQAHLDSGGTRMVPCWYLKRRDGATLRGTEATRDLVLTTGDFDIPGTYKATSNITASDIRYSRDMSVDNSEVTGGLDVDGLALSIDAAEAEGGRFDGAGVLLFLCRWDAPDDGQIILQRGTLGILQQDSDGQYKAELRGLAQALQKPMVPTYGPTCDADLGDSRCGVDVEALTISSSVESVSDGSRARFTDSTTGFASGYFSGGHLTWDSGENQGLSMDVRSFDGEAFVLTEPMSYEITAGDQYSIYPGCDKTRATCAGKFNNIVNFRGFPDIPGRDALVKGPE
jgi:uncharacterized phage protein (TIGR02218 family)